MLTSRRNPCTNTTTGRCATRTHQSNHKNRMMNNNKRQCFFFFPFPSSFFGIFGCVVFVRCLVSGNYLRWFLSPNEYDVIFFFRCSSPFSSVLFVHSRFWSFGDWGIFGWWRLHIWSANQMTKHTQLNASIVIKHIVNIKQTIGLLFCTQKLVKCQVKWNELLNNLHVWIPSTEQVIDEVISST